MMRTPMRRSGLVPYEFDQMIDSFFGGSRPMSAAWGPGVDVVEDADAYRLYAELPGLTKEDVHVEMNENVLTLRGEKRIERNDEGENWHRIERREGAFERSFSLAKPIKADAIKAKFSDGVLTVTVPKADEAKPREISIDY